MEIKSTHVSLVFSFTQASRSENWPNGNLLGAPEEEFKTDLAEFPRKCMHFLCLRRLPGIRAY